MRDLADAHGAALRAVVLDLEAVPYMDSQGSEQLRRDPGFVESQNATLRLARVKPVVRAKLERDGLLGQIGGDRVTATSTAPWRPSRRLLEWRYCGPGDCGGETAVNAVGRR